MSKIILLLTTVSITLGFRTIFAQIINGVNWNGQDRAQSCDFSNNDLTNMRVAANACGPLCGYTNGCTHYAWSTYNGGTCWMKQGAVTKENAVRSNDKSMVCGIMGINKGAPNPPTGSVPLNCIAYEPFSNKDYPGNVDRALNSDLTALTRQGFNCIKTYYSQYNGLKIAEYASKYNLKVVLGIRMGESFSETEIQTAISSCHAFSGNIIAIYAGNENLPNDGITNEILNIKNRVKQAGCNIPFGTVQTIGYFLNNADQNLVNQLDWLGYNVYPFFSNLGGQSSSDSLRAQIGQLKNAYGSRFTKFRIAETGWPSDGGSSPQGNPATLAKAKEYADYFAQMICSREINTPWVSYFTYFDPRYKQNVPEFGHHFGISTPEGEPKWNIQNLRC